MARAQGSGSAGCMVVVGVLVALYCCSLMASSATFTVGGSQGWTIGPDYTTWASPLTFAVGDVLFFPYTQGAHNVAEVDKAGHDTCSATNAIATYTEGNTSVTLTTAGAHYFMCSFPGHCSAGMSLAITVGGNATTPPAPAPSPTVGTPPPTPSNATVPPPAPTPSNATVPPAAPAPAPVSATTPPAPVPSPVGTPVAVPVPAPASASTPTPATPAPAPGSPAPASSSTPAGSPPTTPSSSSPPAPSETTPPSSAPSLSSSTFLAAVLLGLGGAFLAL